MEMILFLPTWPGAGVAADHPGSSNPDLMRTCSPALMIHPSLTLTTMPSPITIGPYLPLSPLR
jgi:hypothetical protein